MKILRILLCMTLVIILSACKGKSSIYDDYPDDPTQPGNAGDPCSKNEDCKSGLLCIDNVCSEQTSDKDTVEDDSDENPTDDTDEPEDDTDTKDDSDSGKTDGDTVPDNDSNPKDDSDKIPDEEPVDDSDSQPVTDEDQVYVPECGNGLRDPGEECDNGTNNSDEPGDYNTCRTDCLKARCGDGIKDNNEICDDGNTVDGDYCSKNCNSVSGYCGDGILQTNEECDPGIEPYCKNDCSGTEGYCGDGIVNGNEVCDNAEPGTGGGEGTGPYYCNLNCSEITGSCGDGIIQLNEECDDKNNNGRYGYCKADCSGPGERCGDGIKQSNYEACDDGNTLDGDYCSKDCKKSYGSCGDGIVNFIPGNNGENTYIEECDNAPEGEGEGTGAYCSNDCTESYGSCGDKTIQTANCGGAQNCVEVEGLNEECDDGYDGNIQNEYGYCPYGPVTGCKLCHRTCKKIDGIPRYCGDGVVSSMNGEACDPAKTDDPNSPYCSSDCKEINGSCGDGIIQTAAGEICDPAKTDDPNSPYCSGNCREINGSCGDGIVNGSEQCDNGSANGENYCQYSFSRTECTVCTASCTEKAGIPRYCGDGLTQAGYENCDSGSSNGTYGNCKADCTGLGEHCGDGIVNGGEDCDDGDNNGNPDCAYGETSCKVCTTNCAETDGHATYCGDGIVNGSEACDDGELNGTYGHCPAGCYGEGERCGDGIVNGNEVCDDGGNNGQYGYCATGCMSEGRRCGDGIVETANGEICDDGENNGKYSTNAPGYCNSDCKGRGEGGICGDGNINESESCDEGSDNGRTACAYGETSCEVCDSSCLKKPGTTSYCGDGIRDILHNEVCDEGAAGNGDYNTPCNSTCSGIPPRCGDGNTDTEHGEACDDAEHNGEYSSSAPGYCSEDCKTEGGGGYCGDGFTTGYETCDSGPLNGHYGKNCNDNCTGYTNYCGDGIVDSVDGEICDDSVNNGKYGNCNGECSAILECGDGILQKANCGGEEGCVEVSGADEECDSGDGNGSATDCAYGDTSCTLCDSECKKFDGNTSFCGDGNTDTANGETCDDAENNGNYGFCNSSCSGYMPKCGDGVINRENCDGFTNCVVTEGVNEACDDGDDNGTYGKCNLNCSGIVECGDGIISDGEICDDGMNNGKYNFCDRCIIEKTGYCGDAVVQKGPGECGGTEGCIELEGAEEECDRASYNGTVTDCTYGLESCEVCTAECKIASGNTAYCGDGKINRENCDGYGDKCVVTEGVNENCDDGDDNGSFGHCDKKCKITINYRCGDGKLQIGNAANCGDTPLCSESLTENCCEVVEFAQGDHDETCDDGALNNTPGHCNSTCDGRTRYCGDGIIQRPDCEGYENCIVDTTMNESCDDGSNNGYYGFCKTDCSGMREERCGDGIVQRDDCTGFGSECVVVPGANEFCDEGSNNGKYYNHCDDNCTGTDKLGYCGDYIVQADDCSAWIAEDPGNRQLCSESVTAGCCKVTAFAPGEESLAETCDEADDSSFHGHCNETCNGISSCGDGIIGKDEICEQGEPLPGNNPIPCQTFKQFKSGTIGDCDDKCMPDLTGCENAESYKIPFFSTGQTKCYDNSGEITPCPASESDEFYGQEPNFSYTDQDFELNDDATVVKEKVSKLFWQKDTPENYGYEKEDSSFVYACEAHSSCTFAEAASYCSNLVIGGYSDWRLPTFAEFTTIMNYAASNHVQSVFTNTRSLYWTMERAEDSRRRLVSSSDGTTTSTSSTSYTAQVKCVRSDDEICSALQCQPTKYFKVLDFDGALITSNSEESFTFWYFGTPAVTKNWKDALEFCKTRDVNGINKMRLPTINELMSIIDPSHDNILAPEFAGKTVWSSTTAYGDAEKAYVVSSGFFGTLETEIKDKDTNNYYVICVE